MFNSESKKESDNNRGNTQNKHSTKDEVYVMPEKFHAQNSSSSNKALFIVLIILVLVVVASAVYFFYDLWSDNSNQQLTDNNANIVLNTNLNQNNGSSASNQPINSNGNSNLNNNLNDNTNSAANNNSNTNSDNSNVANTNDNENTNQNDNDNQNQPIVIPEISTDTDNDGLTDLEENAFGTSVSKPDTDGDGYLDGQEVVSGYNPAKPGSSDADKLPAANFIEVVSAGFQSDNFELLSIDGWNSSSVASNKQVLITTDTGEIIRVSVKVNTEGISAINWYLQNNPQVTLSQLRKIEVGELSGIFSPDGLKVYLIDPQRVKFYVFEYILDAGAEFRYPSIFYMMVKSFKLIDSADNVADLSSNDENSSSTSPTSTSPIE